MNFRAQKLHQAVIATLLLTGSVGALAQSKTIELQTDAGLLPIPLDDNAGLDIGPDGTIFTKAAPGFVCDQGASCDDVAVSLASTDGGALSISPSTVTQGNSFTVQWVSRGAWACTGMGLDSTTWNSNNPKPPSGSASVDTDNLTVGNHLIELVCENGPVSDSRSLALTVEEPSVGDGGTEGLPEVCNDVTTLDQYSGWARAVDVDTPFGTNEDQTFAQMFGPFPGTNSSGNLGIRKNEYMSVVFTTGDLTASSSGRVSREQAQLDGSHHDIGPGPLIASWSRCPGDFDPTSPALPSPGCIFKADYTFNQIIWGGPGSGKACELEPNTQYFLNVVYTNSSLGTMPPVQAECSDEPRCGHLYKAN